MLVVVSTGKFWCPRDEYGHPMREMQHVEDPMEHYHDGVQEQSKYREDSLARGDGISWFQMSYFISIRFSFPPYFQTRRSNSSSPCNP